MRSYDPEWRVWGKLKRKMRAHLFERPGGRLGYLEGQRTLCGRRVGEPRLGAFMGEVRCRVCEAERGKIDVALAGDSNVAYLRESTYAGTCYGAYHWTGSLGLGRCHQVDLTFKLTHLQARKLNAESPDYDRWEAGSVSNRFFTREALRKAAIQGLPKLFPGARALVSGTRWNPGEVLWIKGKGDELLKSLNGAWEAWDQAWDKGDEESAKVGEREFNALLKEGGLKW